MDPAEGRIVLLEHGRSGYRFGNWVLDKSAARHANKHGCWPNRDVRKVLEESGLVVEKIKVSQFGALYHMEARPGERQIEARKRAESEIEIRKRAESEDKTKGAKRWFGG